MNKAPFQKSNFFLLTVLTFFVILTSTCGSSYGLNELFGRDNPVEIRSSSLQNLPAMSALGSSYKVLIITDVHCGAETLAKNSSHPRRDGDFIKKIAAMNPLPAFCICLGDIAEHGYESEFEQYESSITQALKKLGIQTYTIAGNHDLYNSGWQSFTKYTNPGNSFFRFKTASFSYYFLDNASGTLGHPQLDSLSEEMENDPNPKILCAHIPVYCNNWFYFVMQDTADRNELLGLCAKYNTLVFLDGHVHSASEISNLGNFIEKTVPGFYEKSSYDIMSVDEKNRKISFESFTY